ncbi:MAG: hypothetical protein BWY82_02850 [Verrucomicrobia bacterium ADurb.Bin474]|nr:MAG: hypothetical protein BWY82_02850 [Verrucomicrobia bacterium ADurb.Bin474]
MDTLPCHVQTILLSHLWQTTLPCARAWILKMMGCAFGHQLETIKLKSLSCF